MFPGIGGQIAHLPTSLENHCSKDGKSRHYLITSSSESSQADNFFVTENVTVCLSPRFLVPGMNNWDWMRWYSAHQGRESRRAVLAMLLRCNPPIAGMGIALGRQFWRLVSDVRCQMEMQRLKDGSVVSLSWWGEEEDAWVIGFHSPFLPQTQPIYRALPRCLLRKSEDLIYHWDLCMVWMNPVNRQRKKSPPFIPPY